MTKQTPTPPKPNIFTFNPNDYTHEFANNGYVLVKGGINSAFLKEAQQQAILQEENKSDLDEWRFKGKKRQYLYDFENQWDFYQAAYKTLCETTNLNLEKMTLCERHIKVYDSEAKAHVPPHKDRTAAQLTVGIPLSIPEGSHIVIWPNDYRIINPFNSTALWRSSLDEKDLPENCLANIEPARIYAEPGDVVMFRGSSLYHERECPANSSILYLKFNDMRLDPIGEDPATSSAQEKSDQISKGISTEALLDSHLIISPRLLKISRDYTRLYWKEVIQVFVADEKEFTISELELKILQHVQEGHTVSELLTTLGVPEPEKAELMPTILRLIRLKALVLYKKKYQ